MDAVGLREGIAVYVHLVSLRTRARRFDLFDRRSRSTSPCRRDPSECSRWWRWRDSRITARSIRAGLVIRRGRSPVFSPCCSRIEKRDTACRRNRRCGESGRCAGAGIWECAGVAFGSGSRGLFVEETVDGAFLVEDVECEKGMKIGYGIWVRNGPFLL